MTFLRAMLIWVLAFSLPIEAMAANSMSHCKDMQNPAAGAAPQLVGQHDHAAMMAAMSDDASMQHMHHQMQGSSVKKPVKTSGIGCQCGCKCSGDCALSCTGMMVSLSRIGFSFAGQPDAARTILLRGQAHAAYRFDPLRPPSAVTL